MKPTLGNLICVTWVDIQSDSNWTTEETLEPALCVSVGFFNGYRGGNLRIHASYNDQDIGDRIVIPKSVIKDITIIKKHGKKTIRRMGE